MNKRQKCTFTLEEAAEMIMADNSDLELSDREDEEEIELIVPIPSKQKKHDLFNIIMGETECQNEPISENFNNEQQGSCNIVEEPTFEDINIEYVDEKEKCKFTRNKDIQWRHLAFEPSPRYFNCGGERSQYLENEVGTPCEMFLNYIPLEMFEQMATFTNIYALQQGKTSFKATNMEEMIKFVGLHIQMGGLQLPQLRLYWNQNLDIQSVSKAMPINRFSQLRSNIHLVDNNSISNVCTDKFAKMRPLIECVRKRCNETPVEETVSVDEQIIPFKGRLSIKQYMKGKPCPWGIKNFVLCGKSGYPYDFVLYQGKDTEISFFDRAAYGLGASIVKHFVINRLKDGQQLFFDNYFSSYQLFEFLTEKNINAAGTIRINRFNSPNFSSDKQLQKKGRGSAEQICSRDGNLVIVKWQDNKAVHLASNFIGIGNEKIISRWDKKQKKYVDILQPEVVAKYNFGMGGVDLLDQYLSYYRIMIKSRKWTLRVFAHFIDLAACASYIEYKNQLTHINCNEIMSLMDFKLQLAQSLLKIGVAKRDRNSSREPLETMEFRNRVENRPPIDVRRDRVDHLPIHDDSGFASRCKYEGCTGRSRIKCVKCKVHLCLNKTNNCFLRFHK